MRRSKSVFRSSGDREGRALCSDRDLTAPPTTGLTDENSSGGRPRMSAARDSRSPNLVSLTNRGAPSYHQYDVGLFLSLKLIHRLRFHSRLRKRRECRRPLNETPLWQRAHAGCGRFPPVRKLSQVRQPLVLAKPRRTAADAPALRGGASVP
jgi:hypothetical protein